MTKSGFFINLNEENTIRQDLIKVFYHITVTDVFQQYCKSADQPSTVLSHWRRRLAGVGVRDMRDFSETDLKTEKRVKSDVLL